MKEFTVYMVWCVQTKETKGKHKIIGHIWLLEFDDEVHKH